MRHIKSFDAFPVRPVAESRKTDRRDFITGLVTTIGMVPLTAWGVYRIIRSLADEYRSVDNSPKWAASLTVSKPALGFMDGLYSSDPEYPERLERVRDMVKRDFESLEEELELTQKMYDAIVLAGVRVGPDALMRSAFMAGVRSGDFDKAAKYHAWLGNGILPEKASRKAAEHEMDLFGSREELEGDQAVAGPVGAGSSDAAEALREELRRLGHSEHRRELTSNGPITRDLARAVSEVLRRYKEEMPEVRITITAGNDKYHRSGKRTWHNKGRAVDLKIHPYDDETSGAFISVMRQYMRENPRFWFRDEYKDPSPGATGPHFHLQVKR